MKTKEALQYLDDIAHGRKMELDPHELKEIIAKDLDKLEIFESGLKMRIKAAKKILNEVQKEKPGEASYYYFSGVYDNLVNIYESMTGKEYKDND